MSTSNDNVNSIVSEFWEEHIEKSQEGYDPYHYVEDLSFTSDEMLIDFDWEYDELEEE